MSRAGLRSFIDSEPQAPASERRHVAPIIVGRDAGNSRGDRGVWEKAAGAGPQACARRTASLPVTPPLSPSRQRRCKRDSWNTRRSPATSASMGPRPFSRGKRVMPRNAIAKQPLLQWGRGWRNRGKQPAITPEDGCCRATRRSSRCPSSAAVPTLDELR